MPGGLRDGSCAWSDSRRKDSRLVGTRTYLQMRALMSPLPVANTPPVGLGATEMTEFLCPCNINCATPVCGSQNCTPRSLDPLNTQSPCGVSATLSTKSLWPSKVRIHLPLGPPGCPGTNLLLVDSSHILIVLSKLPETRRLPDGANATL
jgi:hypothetical protein